MNIWVRSLLAAAISGAANGVTTGAAAVTIAPETFGVDGAGLAPLIKLTVASAVISAITAVAAYLKQSPLPPEEAPSPPEAKP